MTRVRGVKLADTSEITDIYSRLTDQNQRVAYLESDTAYTIAAAKEAQQIATQASVDAAGAQALADAAAAAASTANDAATTAKDQTLTAKAGAEAAAASVSTLVSPATGALAAQPLAIDTAGNVLLWLSSGLLETLGFGPAAVADMRTRLGLLNYASVEAKANGIDSAIGADPMRAPIIIDAAGNVIAWIAGGKIEALGFGPQLLSAVTTAIQPGIGVVATVGAARRQSLIQDGTNVLLWLEDGAIDAAGIGQNIRTAVRAATRTPAARYLNRTNGQNLSVFRLAIGNLSRATMKTAKAHFWMNGDSQTYRLAQPNAFVDDFRAMNVPVVATGWCAIGEGANGQTTPLVSDGTQSGSIVFNGATVVDLTDTGLSDGGLYGPDGFRATFSAGATGSGFTIIWKGASLTLYHKANGATFRVVTDGGAASDFTAATGGVPSKTVIFNGADGYHTTVLTRPTATNDLEWYGAFANSALPGLIVSKAANSSSSMLMFGQIAGNVAAQYILTDTSPTCFRWNWGANDSRLSNASVSASMTALEAILSTYRTAVPAAEGYFSFPQADGVSGVTSGLDRGEFAEGTIALCDKYGYEFSSIYARWPSLVKSPSNLNLPGDQYHFDPAGGGPAIVAAQERRDFWECR